MGKKVWSVIVVLLSIVGAIYFAPLQVGSYFLAVSSGTPFPKYSVKVCVHVCEQE